MHSPEITAIISHMGAGGAQRVLSIIANEWTRNGRAVEIVTLTEFGEDAYKLDEAVTRTKLFTTRRRTGSGARIPGTDPENSIHHIVRKRVVQLCKPPLAKAASFIQYLRILRRLRHKLRVDRPGLVLAFIGPTNVLTLLACHGLGIRVVISERNDPSRQSFGLIWDFLRRALYRKADLVTANSKQAITKMSEYVPPSRLALLPNPVVLAKIKPRSIRPVKSVLSVGRVVPQKGYDVLLKAFDRVRSMHPDLHLDIAGAGEQLDEMCKLSSLLGLDDAVTWHGHVRDPQPLYNNADIYVLASRFEGTPNALLEAMNFGLPVVVTDALDGAIDLVGDDQAGLVVPVDDPDALAKTIDRLVSDPDLRVRLGEAARRRVQILDVKSVTKQWDSILFSSGPSPETSREVELPQS